MESCIERPIRSWIPTSPFNVLTEHNIYDLLGWGTHRGNRAGFLMDLKKARMKLTTKYIEYINLDARKLFNIENILSTCKGVKNQKDFSLVSKIFINSLKGNN